MTDKEFLDRLIELSKKITKGDWEVWDGPAYVGGAKDLCIGAGDKWLYNMDHPECRARWCHMEIPEPGCEHPPCELNPNVDILSGASGEACNPDCEHEHEITEEQAANAKLIVLVRNNLDRIIDLFYRTVRGQ